ncbi:MAG: diguanylate cyclase [Rubrivivax sp.]|nr:diguanylate cyclase [Rubrivivax sp.]
MPADAASSSAPPSAAALNAEGDFETALRAAHDALATTAGAARGPLLLSRSRCHLGAGRLQDALRDAIEACDLAKADASAVATCDALTAMAMVLRAAGDHASAIDTLEQAEALARELHDAQRVSRVLRTLGVCSSILGRHQHALSCLHEALESAEQAGDVEHRLLILQSLYNAHSRQADGELVPGPAGDAVRAQLQPFVERWQQLAEAFAATGQPRQEAMALGNRAILLQQCGRPVEAIPLLQGLLPRYRALGMRPNEAICHNELGRCFALCGDAALARDHYRVALEMLDEEGSLDERLEVLEGLSRAEENLGRLAEALAALREVRRLEARKSDSAARAAVSRRELRVELARLTSQWAQQARQDPLTGLGNRRALEAWLAEQQPRAARGEAMSLLLMDLDHFKQVNDHFGHDAGDEVLRRVAALLRSHCRSGDLAVRYGGEEFLLVLVGTTPAEAQQVAERVRASVAALPWEQLRPGLVVTVSVGVSHHTEALEAAGLLTLADQRLYRAKIGGRNGVVAA